MAERMQRFINELKKTISNLGSATSKTLNSLSEADKKINESMKKSMGSGNNY